MTSRSIALINNFHFDEETVSTAIDHSAGSARQLIIDSGVERDNKM